MALVIPAAKAPRLERWLAGHARARLARSFTRVQVLGLAHVRAALEAGPVLVVSNHTAWWDALVILWLGRLVLGADGYALMDARNLRRLPFFRWVGAFGVDLEDRADGARALRHAARLLDRARRLVWIFPQGRERPVTARPLAFAPGAAAIARLAPACRVVPAALRYEHGEEPEPVAYVAFGEALPRGRRRSHRHRGTGARGGGAARPARRPARGGRRRTPRRHPARPQAEPDRRAAHACARVVGRAGVSRRPRGALPP